MNRSIRTNLLAACLCVLVTLVAADCGPGGDEAPPQGMVVTSLLVSSKEYTADGGRYDLFLRTIPGEKIARLTHHDASPKLRLGGAIREPLFSHDGKSSAGARSATSTSCAAVAVFLYNRRTAGL